MSEVEVVEAQPELNGKWSTLSNFSTEDINPVHAALMHTGEVLFVAGSGHKRDNHEMRIFRAAVWNPEAGTLTKIPLAWDMFCNGMVVLPSGEPFVLGGTLAYSDPNGFGEPRTAVFDPIRKTFTDGPRMSGGRWYPTGTVLGNGSVLVVSGLRENGQPNPSVQRGMGGNWTSAGTGFYGLYPRQHLLPDGKVFVSGEKPQSQLYNPATQTFTQVATTIYGQRRTYGASVLLPLRRPAFTAEVMILGGATTATTELINLSDGRLSWRNGPEMARPRNQLNATILPNGKVLVSGGMDGTTGVKRAQIYNRGNPDDEDNIGFFRFASTMQFTRGYHSTALLLPDATVAAFGGEPRGVADYVKEVEVYSPDYLFNPGGSLATRPTITSVAPVNIRYGAWFEVRHDAPNVSSVVLIRPGAPTHAFDMEQRLVELRFTPASGVLRAQAPANGNLAPPGHYMLFILSAQGVPSKAQFVRLVPGEDGAIALTAVGASSSLPGAPPSAAVDGNHGTSWNSGGFPPASIDLDLGAPHAVTRMRLRVNQLPNGNTTHEIYGGPSLSSLTLLHTLSEFTTVFTWLEASFSPAARDVRFLRVRTTVSPSWVSWCEFEVYGTAGG